jgi:hypothetical protein
MSIPVYKPVWRCEDAETERDVLAFWRENQLLPANVDPAKRLRDLCVVAYDGGRVVGVIETEVKYNELVRAKLAMIKLAVAPSHRKTLISAYLFVFGSDVIEHWANQNLEEKVMGLGSIAQVRGGAARAESSNPYLKEAVWGPRNHFVVINHTPEGAQFRLAWFRHARID